MIIKYRRADALIWVYYSSWQVVTLSAVTSLSTERVFTFSEMKRLISEILAQTCKKSFEMKIYFILEYNLIYNYERKYRSWSVLRPLVGLLSPTLEFLGNVRQRRPFSGVRFWHKFTIHRRVQNNRCEAITGGSFGKAAFFRSHGGKHVMHGSLKWWKWAKNSSLRIFWGYIKIKNDLGANNSRKTFYNV